MEHLAFPIVDPNPAQDRRHDGPFSNVVLTGDSNNVFTQRIKRIGLRVAFRPIASEPSTEGNRLVLIDPVDVKQSAVSTQPNSHISFKIHLFRHRTSDIQFRPEADTMQVKKVIRSAVTSWQVSFILSRKRRQTALRSGAYVARGTPIQDNERGGCASWPTCLTLAILAAAYPSVLQAETCFDAARAAEQHSGLPSGLLAAIGRVESGGWEWSVNGNGTNLSQRFTGADAAEAYTKSLLASGHRIVDVGCFQIDLFYHPEAFSRWQDAFDNVRSADAAAGILKGLYRSTGNWNRAIAMYHSADPERGHSYLQSVLSIWKGSGYDGPIVSSEIDPYVVEPIVVRIPVAIWIPGGRTRASYGGESRLPHVITP